MSNNNNRQDPNLSPTYGQAWQTIKWSEFNLNTILSLPCAAQSFGSGFTLGMALGGVQYLKTSPFYSSRSIIKGS